MKLTFRNGCNKKTKITAILTTKSEKEFINGCKDDQGRYKPWVYDILIILGNEIINNPFDNFDEYTLYQMEMVDKLKVDSNTWKDDDSHYLANYLPEIQVLTMLDLFYYFKHSNRKLVVIKQSYLHMKHKERWHYRSRKNYRLKRRNKNEISI